MRRRHPLFDPLPPGYSGPAPLPRPPKGPQHTPPGEPEVLEEIPFDLSETSDRGQGPPVDRADMPLPKPRPRPMETPQDSTPSEGESEAPKIRNFEQRLSGNRRHEDEWNRSPNSTGTGAIHVKSFHCKLTGDSLEFLDRQVNEWLDAHPQYEVKFVTTSVGTWTGKLKEPNLIMNVWV
ncbi:MAG: hypothetical protein ACF8Q5_12945 [Phycisphaerales bacterium JB040]